VLRPAYDRCIEATVTLERPHFSACSACRRTRLWDKCEPVQKVPFSIQHGTPHAEQNRNARSVIDLGTCSQSAVLDLHTERRSPVEPATHRRYRGIGKRPNSNNPGEARHQKCANACSERLSLPGCIGHPFPVVYTPDDAPIQSSMRLEMKRCLLSPQDLPLPSQTILTALPHSS